MKAKPDVGWAMRACPRRSAYPAYGSGPRTGRAMAAAGGGTWERSRADSASLSPSIGTRPTRHTPCMWSAAMGVCVLMWVHGHGHAWAWPGPAGYSQTRPRNGTGGLDQP